MRTKPYLPLLVLFVFWVLATALFEWADLDRKISAAFFDAERGGFYLEDTQPFLWLYHKGTAAGPVLALSAASFWLLGHFKARFAPYRRQWAAVLLCAVVGGGILVNGLLKDYWGRPRPRQVSEFGGHWQYRPIAQPGTPGKGKSFPCGHCTSGFLAVSTAVFLPTHPLLASAGVVFGLGYGALMSSARIVQGAHFFSDAFWALGVVAMTTYLFYLLLVRGHQPGAASGLTRRGRWGLVLGGVAFTLVTLAAFMTRRPYFKTYHDPLPLPPETARFELQLSEDPAQFRVDYKALDHPILEVHAQGLGWTEATHRVHYWMDAEGKTQVVKARFEPIHYFSEINHQVILWLPLGRKDSLKVEVRFNLEPPFN